MIGPLFRWELVRLARRGQTLRVRGILTFVVLSALFLFTIYRFWEIPIQKLFLDRPQVSIEESAAFGEQFAMTFLIAQLLVVIGLTPAYAAGGLAEEKERRSIDFLLTSALTDREIVLGPFVARWVFLMAVIFTGLPILLLTLLYGGVDPQIVLASYGITLGTMTMLSALSLISAVYAETFRGAMFRAYSLTILFAIVGFGCFYISPLFVLFSLRYIRNDLPLFLGVSIAYPLVQCLIALGLVVLAVKRLRTINEPPPRPTMKSESIPKSKPISIPLVPIKPPIDEDRPFDWKEKYVVAHRISEDDDAISGLKLTAYIVIVTSLFVFTCIDLLQIVSNRGRPVNLGWITAVGLMMQLLFIGMTACGQINSERQKLTWESLLTIPVDHRVILDAKYRQAISKGWWWGLPCAVVASMVVAFHGGVLAWVGSLVYFTALIVVSPVVGLLLSARLPLASRSLMYYLPVAIIGPFLPLGLVTIADGPAWLHGMILIGLAAGLTLSGWIARLWTLKSMVSV